jgi:tetratricopeptide (TPR) repeat protein
MLAAAMGASRLAPGSHWSYNVGSALSELGRFDEAVRAFDDVDRGKGWTRGWKPFWERFTSALHFAHDYRRELEIAREARRQFPTDPWPLYWEARALAAMRRVKELDRVLAELRASQLPKDHPLGFGSLLSWLGWELEMKGDSANAFRLYGDGIAWLRALPPKEDPEFRREWDLADLLYRAGRLSEAQALYERIFAPGPNRPIRPPAELGCIFVRRGQRAGAEQILGQVVADTGTRFGEHKWGWAARIAACLGDRDRMVEFIRRQNVRQSNRPYLLYVKGFGLLPQFTELDHKDFDAFLGYAPYQAVRLVKR